MKRLRLILAGGFLGLLLTASPAPGGTAPRGTGLGLEQMATPPSPARARPRLTGSEIVIAEAAPDEGSYQVPVVEGEELPDSPAADAARGEAESQVPAVEQPPSRVDVPRADQPPEVPQPGATP